MTDRTDEDPANPGEAGDHKDTWRGLDEAQLRMDIRNLVQDIHDHEVDSHPRLIRQLARVRQVVQEELAAVLRSDFNYYVDFQDTSTRAACERLAQRVNGDLAELGLAYSHPEAPFPARLGVAQTEPTGKQLWLQLEPLDPSAGHRPYRLSVPLGAKLELVPEPVRAPGPVRGSGRSR